MKKILLIVIDSLTDRLLRPLMDEGELTTFAAVRDRGQLRTITSVFPSITQACLSSIATGHYPRDHDILGVHWYSPDKEDEAYFGTDPGIIFQKGIRSFFQDFMVDLNGERLVQKTIFQKVEEAGMTAASLNFMFFRGDVTHNVNLPFLVSLLPGVYEDELTVKGPATLYMGEFVQSSAPGVPRLDVQGGLGNWFGFKDDNTAHQLLQLAQKRAFPNFTLAYFPHNDYLSHSAGPEEAHYQLKGLDRVLEEMFEAYGGIDSFMQEMCLIIAGDHAQSDIRDDSHAAISLVSLLEPEFDAAAEGQMWESDYDVLVCANLRAAQLYFKDPAPSKIDRAIGLLLEDERVDQVICRASTLVEGAEGYQVAKRGERLIFRPGSQAQDAQGNGWDWRGELAVVDGCVEGARIAFPNYPNAFERIAGVLDSDHSGELWITASLGCEFEAPMAGIHQGGGSHGSLHAQDSLSSLLLAGNCDNFDLPAFPRLVDIETICLSILGIGQNS